MTGSPGSALLVAVGLKGEQAVVWPLTRERHFIAHAFFISYFEGYSYLCLLLIPRQLGERT